MTHRTLFASTIIMIFTVMLGSGCRVKPAAPQSNTLDNQAYDDNAKDWEDSNLPVCQKRYDYKDNGKYRNADRLRKPNGAKVLWAPVDVVLSITKLQDYTDGQCFFYDFQASAESRKYMYSQMADDNAFEKVLNFLVPDNRFNPCHKLKVASQILKNQFPELAKVRPMEGKVINMERFYFVWLLPKHLGCKLDVRGGYTDISVEDPLFDPYSNVDQLNTVDGMSRVPLPNIGVWYHPSLEKFFKN
jgi:hypothetical protein